MWTTRHGKNLCDIYYPFSSFVYNFCENLEKHLFLILKILVLDWSGTRYHTCNTSTSPVPGKLLVFSITQKKNYTP